MKDTPYSVLMLAYGQSNSDIYPAEPALACDAFDDPRIVTFNDGSAFRGLLGQVPKQPVTALVPAMAASHETKKCRNYQSFQIAAAARLLREYTGEGLAQVIVRAEGRGGRRFQGTIATNDRHVEGIVTNVDGSDSQILLNMFETIRLSAELARQQGAPLRRIIINFLHGEADRGSSRAAYRADMVDLVHRVDALAAQIGVSVDWLVLDPAGTSINGSGNNWPCRLAMRDVADATANVHLTGAGYAYQLDDRIHYSAEARVLFGEHLGAAASHLLFRDEGTESDFGWLFEAPRVGRAILSDTQVYLELDGYEAFELVPGLSDANLNVEGFDTTAAARCKIIAAEQTGPRNVRITLDQSPHTDDGRAALTYAYQIVMRHDPRDASPLPAGRGGWRSVKALDSMALPGQRIHQWVPGLFLPFGEMTRG